MSYQLTIKVAVDKPQDSNPSQAEYKLTPLSYILIVLLIGAVLASAAYAWMGDDTEQPPTPVTAQEAAVVKVEAESQAATPDTQASTPVANVPKDTLDDVRVLPADIAEQEAEAVSKSTSSPSLTQTVVQIAADLKHTDASQVAVAQLPTAEPEIPQVPGNDELQQSDVIKRQLLTRAVLNREPVDNLVNVVVIQQALEQVSFFTELQAYSGDKLHHQWYYENTLMADVVLPIGGSHWRTYSRKKLRADWQGQWRIDVLDQQGKLISRYPFSLRTAQHQE